MTLLELQEILGQRIKIAVDNTLYTAERMEEAEISRAVASLAKQMINNADIVLRTDKLTAEGRLQHSNIQKMVGRNEKQNNGKSKGLDQGTPQ